MAFLIFIHYNNKTLLVFLNIKNNIIIRLPSPNYGNGDYGIAIQIRYENDDDNDWFDVLID